MAGSERAWRAVFSDIDGTLIGSDKRMSPATAEALRACAERGVFVTLSSSRSPQGIEPLVRDNDLRCCISAFGGGLLLDEGRRVLARHGFSPQTACDVVGFLECGGYDVTWNVYTADEWIVRDVADPRVRREEDLVRTTARDGRPQDLGPGDVVCKLLLMSEPEDSPDIERDLRAAFPQLAVTRSSDILVEVNARGVNKGVAVRELCEARGIDVADTIAFGDNYNDLRMLEAAGLSVVMGNAPADIRRDAGMVTDDNDHDGVAHALHALILDRA